MGEGGPCELRYLTGARLEPQHVIVALHRAIGLFRGVIFVSGLSERKLRMC